MSLYFNILNDKNCPYGCPIFSRKNNKNMKIGIHKIETIDSVNVRDFSFFSPGSTISLNSFLKSPMREIIFTEGTATYEEAWSEESGGKLSTITISGVNRMSGVSATQILLRNLYQSQVLRITLKNKTQMIVGSLMFPAKFSLTDSIDGVTTHDKRFTFECKSPHGAYFVKD